jgi:hypothetical protein
MLDAMAFLLRWQRLARAQVRPHEQRIEDACGRSRVGQPLVAAWGHLRQRERGATQHAR